MINVKMSFIYLLLLAVMGSANATHCRVNGGGEFMLGSGTNNDIRANITANSGTNRILLSGFTVECRYSYSNEMPNEDYAHVETPGFNFGPKFSRLTGGLIINNGAYPNPLSGRTGFATMPSNNPPPWVPMNVYPYIDIKGSPITNVDIRAGDVIGSYHIYQDNNYRPGATSFTIRFIANNDFIIAPSTCTINNNNPISINFGTVDGRSVGDSALTTEKKVIQRLNYSCPTPGLTQPITITLKGTGAAFDSSLAQMNNANLGVGMLHNGSVVPLNNAFRTNLNNSSGGDDVTFALVRKPGSVPAVGASQGSAVLVMGVP
jgi:minor fimbrial subunit